MDAWKNAFFLQHKPMKFLVLGGGGILGFGGEGGKCRFYFYGRGDFSDNKIGKISKLYCHGISQEKQRFGTMFRKISLPNPLQNAKCINIVV